MGESEYNKIGKYFWMRPETNKLINTHVKTDDKRSRSDFLDAAVKYYCCYLDSEADKEVLNDEVIKMSKAVVNDAIDHCCRSMFKVAGELGVVTDLIAALAFRMSDEEIRKLRAASYDRVRKQHGFIRLEDSMAEERRIANGE